MHKNNILNILEEDVFPVYSIAKEAIDTNNGLLNKQYIEGRRKRQMVEVMSHLVDDLIHVKQEYPENNISDVTLTADFVIMKREDFDLIKDYIENE